MRNPITSAIFVILVLILISVASVYVSRLVTKEHDMKRGLSALMAFLVGCLVAVWVASKVVYVNVGILSKEESTGIFTLISSITSAVFGYFLGAKNEK